MPRISQAKLKERAQQVLKTLKQIYGNPPTALSYHNPWELLVATVLSAQTTDENVNRVTPVLFARYRTPFDLATANPETVEQIIFSTGFFRQKTRSVIELSAQLVDEFGGEVPTSLEELTRLKGVGRKTASVVVAEVYNQPAIAVDTHVSRISQRLGLSRNTTPEKIEADLKRLYPEAEWSNLSMRLIQFGRDVCHARNPQCSLCPLSSICPWPKKQL